MRSIRRISSISPPSSTNSLSSLGVNRHSEYRYEDTVPADCYPVTTLNLNGTIDEPYSMNGHTSYGSANFPVPASPGIPPPPPPTVATTGVWSAATAQQKPNCFWSFDFAHQETFITNTNCVRKAKPIKCSNKYGFFTIPGVENIDSFLLTLRFFGFDLWMNRCAETGKKFTKRNRITKFLFYLAVVMINCQMFIHIATILHIFLTKKKNFYNFLDDIRTFILKFTMTFAVDLWYLRSRSYAGMTHFVAINYLRANNPNILHKLSIRWILVLILFTVTHWAISQYWLSSMTVEEHRKWLNVVRCAMDNDWLVKKSIFTVAVLRSIATLDSYIYRMFIYGSRFAIMSAYCMLSMLLARCIRQLNDLLTDHLNNEYHYHHYYCRRTVQKKVGTKPRNQCQANDTGKKKFHFETFKEKFNIIYRMHQELEQCFGSLNFIWFGSLFVVSCIDIFFLVWSAGSEWFRVWSFLEFISMIVLWTPHFLVAYFASHVSYESRRMKLHLKELCRQDEEVRDIIVSSIFYPRIKPTLNGVVKLDIGFFLSFICTLVTFSVMLIQLNPDASAKVG